MTDDKRPLKVFLRHAHLIPLWGADRDTEKALYTRLAKGSANAWLDNEYFSSFTIPSPKLR